MSAEAQIETASLAKENFAWALWRRQIATIVRLEIKKNFVGKRAWLIYLFALIPPAMLTLVTIVVTFVDVPDADSNWRNVADANQIFAYIFEILILRTIIFFGCAWIFMNSFRGEVIDRSLHYYFLAPVRREVLVVAKFIAGVAASIVFFSVTTALSMFLMYVTRDGGQVADYFTRGAGVSHAATYLGVAWLACAGYGALFIVIGLVFRNPVLPALTIYGWEFINFLLPPVLKRTGVIYYLQSLTPIKLSEGGFAFIAEPSPALVSIGGLLIFVVVMLVIAAWRIRRMEISYGNE